MSSPAHSPLKLPSHKLLTGICGNTIFNGIFILLLFQDFFLWSSNFCSLELLVKPLIWLAGWKPGRSWLGRLQQSAQIWWCWAQLLLLSGRTGSVQDSLRPGRESDFREETGAELSPRLHPPVALVNSHRGSHHLLTFLLPGWEGKYCYRIMCCNS